MDVEELTPVAQDYLKVIWSAVEWGEPPISTKGLAARFATSQANVSETMRRLQAQGLVTYEPYRPAQLTPLGEQLAIAMVRRHRLVETFLADVLGYGWEEVHDEAERLEHAVTDRLLDRIDQLLGYPVIDPHGDPIPTADGRWTHPPEGRTLAEAAPGDHRVVRVADTDSELLTRMRTLRIGPGNRLTVSQSPPIHTQPDGTPIELTPEDLAQIRVRPWDHPAGP